MTSTNSSAYYQRRQTLLSELELRGDAPCCSLAAYLGWDSAEVRAKLMSLRTDGYVTYRDGRWRPTFKVEGE